MNQSFLSRINKILGGRSRYPWGEQIGLGRGAVSSLFRGSVPSGETLSLICRAENVSLSWLLEGMASPFLVGVCHSDEECAEHFGELLAEKDWTIHLVTDDHRVTLVLTQPGQFDVKGRPVDYTILEILAGPIGQATLARVRESGCALRLANVHSEILDAINSGQMGTYSLTGGILAQAREIGPGHPVLTQDRAAEPCAEYSVSGDETELLEAFRSLDTPRRRAALAAVRAMANS